MQDRTDAPLDREWMIAHFGEPYPAEVVGLLFGRLHDGMPMGEFRAMIRALGEQRLRERRTKALDDLMRQDGEML